MLTTYKLLSAIIPSLLLLGIFAFVLKLESNKQQLKVIQSFLLGMFFVLPVAILENKLEVTFQSNWLDTMFENFLIIGVIEEIAKYLIIFYIFKETPKKFQTASFLFLTAISAAAGFSLIENIIYVHDGGFTTALMRAFSSIPMHFSTALIIAYMILKGHLINKKWFGIFGFVIAVIMHGSYNTYAIMLSHNQPYGVYIIANIYFLIGCYLIFRSLKKEREMNEESEISETKS